MKSVSQFVVYIISFLLVLNIYSCNFYEKDLSIKRSDYNIYYKEIENVSNGEIKSGKINPCQWEILFITKNDKGFCVVDTSINCNIDLLVDKVLNSINDPKRPIQTLEKIKLSSSDFFIRFLNSNKDKLYKVRQDTLGNNLKIEEFKLSNKDTLPLFKRTDLNFRESYSNSGFFKKLM